MGWAWHGICTDTSIQIASKKEESLDIPVKNAISRGEEFLKVFAFDYTIRNKRMYYGILFA